MVLGDLLQNFSLTDIGASAILALVVLLILRGRLVPREQMLDKTAEANHWRESADKSQASVHELGIAVHDLVRAVDRLTALGEASNHALNEIQRALDRGREAE